MSMWNDIKKSVTDFADKAAKKTEELTDAAAMKIKIANKEAERDSEYKNLGRLIYEKLGDADEQRKEQLTEAIAESIKKLDATIAELTRLNKEYNEAKAAREAEKNAKQSSKSANDGNGASQNDEDFMNDFNDARRAGDEEAEKARQASKAAADAAEEAKKMSDGMKDDAEKI